MHERRRVPAAPSSEVHHTEAGALPSLQLAMASRQCYHCKQQIEEGEAHDCWTTTEAALTQELSEDLQEAWQRLRETAVELGEQRIYASHNSIMFSRTSCYFFVQAKRDVPGSLRVPRPAGKRPGSASHASGLEDKDRAHPSHPSPRRGRSANHRLAAAGVRVVRGAKGRSRRKGRRDAGESGEEDVTEVWIGKGGDSPRECASPQAPGAEGCDERAARLTPVTAFVEALNATCGFRPSRFSSRGATGGRMDRSRYPAGSRSRNPASG